MNTTQVVHLLNLKLFFQYCANCSIFLRCVTPDRHVVFVAQVPFIVNTLWDALLELDDLTASTNSIMTLLSSLLTYPQVRQCR